MVVDETGTLIASSGRALYRVAPTGEARRIADGDIDARMLHPGGTATGRRRAPRDPQAAIDTETGLITAIIETPSRAGDLFSGFIVPTEPFGAVALVQWLDAAVVRARMVWRIPGEADVEMELPREYAEGRRDGWVRIGCRGFLWSTPGIVEVYPGVFLRHTEEREIGAGFSAPALPCRVAASGSTRPRRAEPRAMWIDGARCGPGHVDRRKPRADRRCDSSGGAPLGRARHAGARDVDRGGRDMGRRAPRGCAHRGDPLTARGLSADAWGVGALPGR